MAATFQHIPVLFAEVLAALAPRPGGVYLDGTLGGGGHAAGVLAAAQPGGTLIGIDADPAALAAAREHLVADGIPPASFILHHGRFGDMQSIAHSYGIREVDGILLDLGVSSYQLDTPARGFSFTADGPLDMRLDPTGGPSAADLVNDLAEETLADLIYRYGEERLSRRVARQIVERRAKQPFTTTVDLATVVARAVGRGKHERIHPATRTFQALRIAVNAELDQLERALPQAVDLLRGGGRLAVISFHSLEDRIVKRFMQARARGCVCPPDLPQCVCGHEPEAVLVLAKSQAPRKDELERNPRSHSARLRALVKAD